MATTLHSVLIAVASFDKRAWPCLRLRFSLSRISVLWKLSNNYNYLGDATLGNTLTYRIQEIPSNDLTAQRSIAWIGGSDFPPVRSEFYNYARSPVQIEDYCGIQN
jgi:hypothetical protein